MTTPEGPHNARVVLTADTTQYTSAMDAAAQTSEAMAKRTVTALDAVAAAWRNVAAEAASAKAAAGGAFPPVPRMPFFLGNGTGGARFPERQRYRADNAIQAQNRRDEASVADLERRRIRAEERVADASRAGLSKAAQLEQARFTLVEKRAAAEKAAAVASQAAIAADVAKAQHAAIAGQAITSGGKPADRRRLAQEQAQAAKDVTAAQREATKAAEFSADAAERAAMAQARLGTLESQAANEARAMAGRRAEAYNSISQGATRMGMVLVGAFGASAYAAIKWEDQFTAIARITQKQMDATGMSADTLEKQIRNLARTTPASHSQLAEIYTQAAQLGVAPQNLTKFSQAIVQLGTVTDISATQAADKLARLINITGDTTDSISEIGSALVELSNNGASTVPQIIAIATRFAGAAQIVRLQTSEILGISSTLASTGLQAEVAGSAMQRIFFKIYQAAYQGGDALRGFASATHLTTQGFRELFSDNSGDSSGAAKVLLKIVGAMHETTAAGGDVSSMLDRMGIKNVRDIRTLTALAAAYAQLSTDLTTAHDAYQANTALEDAYNKQRGTTLNQLRTAKNRIVDDAISLGATVLPALASIADKVADIADAFGALAPWQRKAIEYLGLFGGAGLLAFAGLSKFAGMVTAISRAFTILRGTQGAAAVQQAAMTQATVASAQATAAAASANVALARAQVAVAATGDAAAAATLAAAEAAEAQAIADYEAAAAAGRLAAANRANTGGGLAGAAGSVGKLSGYATVAIGVVYGLSKATDALNKSAYGAVNIADYADSLKLFVDSGTLAGVAADELGVHMENLNRTFEADKGDGGWREKLRNFGNTTAGIFSLGKLDTGSLYDDLLTKLGSKNNFRDAEQSIGDLDKALEQMVSSGNAKQAAILWVQIKDAWVASKRPLDDLPAAFARYTAAASGPLGITQKLADAADEAAQKQTDLRDSLADLEAKFLGTSEAQDKYAKDLLDLQELAKKSAVSIDDLRAAVSKSVDSAFAAGDANDKYRSSLNDLRTALHGTKDDAKSAADAMNIMSTAIDKALDIAFDPQDVVDKFNAKIDEIKDSLSGPDDSVRDALVAKINLITQGELDKNDPELQRVVEALRKQLADSLKSTPGNLSAEGDSPAARKNRADIEDLIRTQADLSKLTADVNDPGPAFRARRKALESALNEIGYSQADIAKALNKFDSLPETLAEAAKLNPKDKSGSGGTAPRSTSLKGNTDDAIANRNAIRDLVGQTADRIEQDRRFGKSQAEVAQATKDYRAELRKQLIDMGFAARDFEPMLKALDGIPDAYAKANKGSADARQHLLAVRAAARTLAKDVAQSIQDYADAAPRTAQQIADFTDKAIADYDRQTKALNLGPNAELKKMKTYLREVGDTIAAPEFKVDTSGAKSQIKELENAISQVTGKDIKLNVDNANAKAKFDALYQWRNDLQVWFNKYPLSLVAGVGIQPGDMSVGGGRNNQKGGQTRAGGGWVHGPGGPREDKVHLWASPKEFVVNAADAMKNGPLLEAINSGKYRSGMAAPFDKSRFSRAPAPAAAAPQINVSGMDTAALERLIGNQQVAVNVYLDSNLIDRQIGRTAKTRRRTG